LICTQILSIHRLSIHRLSKHRLSKHHLSKHHLSIHHLSIHRLSIHYLSFESWFFLAAGTWAPPSTHASRSPSVNGSLSVPCRSPTARVAVLSAESLEAAR
jgi:hypothetical protein